MVSQAKIKTTHQFELHSRYLDEMEISETRSEFTRIESDDGAKLVIKEVTSELSGQYSCKLSNDHGFTESSAKLTVNCSSNDILRD